MQTAEAIHQPRQASRPFYARANVSYWTHKQSSLHSQKIKRMVVDSQTGKLKSTTSQQPHVNTQNQGTHTQSFQASSQSQARHPAVESSAQAMRIHRHWNRLWNFNRPKSSLCNRSAPEPNVPKDVNPMAQCAFKELILYVSADRINYRS